ncbi:uncharacterized protein G2W53_003556 [Senna tora]|uniref:Uncharacterized protein n=1 Tax=Senna tora TaxID=362788 RepID=A0A834XDR4_9FABA|nr:uncharacterized protein G2W53_003556 [Senna tora]
MNSCIPSTDRLKFWPSCRTTSNLESKASSLASTTVLLLDGGCRTCRYCCPAKQNVPSSEQSSKDIASRLSMSNESMPRVD